jgi:hypothetical protein
MLSRNHCCNGKAKTSSRCIVEQHVTVNNRNILSVAQKYFYGEFMLPETIKVLSCSYMIFCPILNKFGFSRNIFIKVHSIRFQGIRPVAVVLIHADRRTDTTKLTGNVRLCESAQNAGVWHHSCTVTSNVMHIEILLPKSDICFRSGAVSVKKEACERQDSLLCCIQ